MCEIFCLRFSVDVHLEFGVGTIYLEVSVAANPGEKRLRRCWEISPFSQILPLPGERATGPREGATPRPPLAKLDIGGNSFAGDTKG